MLVIPCSSHLKLQNLGHQNTDLEATVQWGGMLDAKASKSSHQWIKIFTALGWNIVLSQMYNIEFRHNHQLTHNC